MDALEVWEKIRKRYEAIKSGSQELSEIDQKWRTGEMSYADAIQKAEILSRAQSEALRDVLTQYVSNNEMMSIDLANETVRRGLEQLYDEISAEASILQKQINKNAGIGMKPVIPKMNESRIDGIVSRLAGGETYEKIEWILKSPVEVFGKSVVDDTAKENAHFQYEAGLSPKIVRTMRRPCCEWCAKLAGEYDYESAPQDVYRRHENCDCVVELVTRKGRQNVHTKKWTS